MYFKIFQSQTHLPTLHGHEAAVVGGADHFGIEVITRSPRGGRNPVDPQTLLVRSGVILPRGIVTPVEGSLEHPVTWPGGDRTLDDDVGNLVDLRKK